MKWTDQVLVSGHRGESIGGIENTLTAIRRAIHAGVDMIETDVHMTKDRELILMHDEYVDRTTDGHGYIRDLTLAEIRKLNAVVHASEPLTPEPPPTLREFLDEVKDVPNLLLNIEFKDYPIPGNEDFAWESVDKIARLLMDYGYQSRTWINSFSGAILEHVYEEYGNAFRYHGFYPWFILGPMKKDPESFIDLVCMQSKDPGPDGKPIPRNNPLCPKEWFDYLLEKDIMPLMAPSLKDFSLYDKAFQWGSRIVNYDDPPRMIAFLKEKGWRKNN